MEVKRTGAGRYGEEGRGDGVRASARGETECGEHGVSARGEVEVESGVGESGWVRWPAMKSEGMPDGDSRSRWSRRRLAIMKLLRLKPSSSA